MISDYFEYFINDVVYVVSKNSYTGKFSIDKEKITKIIINDHSKYDYLFSHDVKLSNCKAFDTFEEAKECCKNIIKSAYDLDIKAIDEIKDDKNMKFIDAEGYTTI